MADRFTATEGGSKLLQESQCKTCKNNTSGKGCKVFGIKPPDYVSASKNLKCTEREEK